MHFYKKLNQLNIRHIGAIITVTVATAIFISSIPYVFNSNRVNAISNITELQLEKAKLGINLLKNTSIETTEPVRLTSELESKKSNLKKFYSDLSSKYEYELKLRTEVNNLVSYLRAQGSPVASYTYARQIITTARANGADYRIIVAIMGVESGFCNANYKIYNCFGYLNGAQYGSYTQAFASLIPKISRQYANVYGTNFTALASAYGIVNVDYHVTRMSSYYYSI